MLTLLFLAFVAMVLGIGEICRDLHHDVSLYSSVLSADEVNAIVAEKVDEALLPDRINEIIRGNVMAALREAAGPQMITTENAVLRLTFDGGAMVCRDEALAHLLAMTLEAAGLKVETEVQEGEKLLLPIWDDEYKAHVWTAA